MRRPRVRHRHIKARVDILAQEELAPRRDRPVSLVATIDDLALVLLNELGIGQHLAPINYSALTDTPPNIERDLPRVGITVVSESL
mgnify:CR=1 FL=1